MNVTGLDVAQDARVVGDEHDAAPGFVVDAVHSLGHDAQGINIEAGVGFVENREAGLEEFSLEDLEPLLLTAGKTHVDIALGEVGVHAQKLHGFLHVLHPGAQLRSLTGDRGFRGAKEVGYGHARDLDWVLHGKEEPSLRSLIHTHFGDELVVEPGFALGDLIVGVTGEGVGEGGLA